MFLERVEIRVAGGQEAALEAALSAVRQRVFTSPEVAPGVVGFEVAVPRLRSAGW
jgi:hypothetical protein